MANRYGGSYRNGNGYGNFGPPPPQPQQSQSSQQQQQQQQQPPQLSSSPSRQPPQIPQGGPQSVSPARQRLAPQQQDEYDPYGDGYSSSNGGGGGGGGGQGGGGQGGGYMSSSSRGGGDRSDRSGDRGDRGDRDRRPPPRMGPAGGGGGGGGRQMYQQADSEDEPYDQYDGRGPLPPSQRRPRQQPSQQNLQPQQQYVRDRGDRGDRGGSDRGERGDRGGGDRGYGSSQPERRQIGQDALDRIRTEWPAMCQTDCVPVQMALQLLDGSSVGRAHEYRAFQRTHQYLQDSLKGIVHDYHQGFNSSIGTFHKIQSSIQASQKKVRVLKEGLAASKTSLCKTDPELAKLYTASQQYDDLLQTLTDLDELRQVPERLEARISEKQFLTAVEVLQNALRKLRKPELDGIGALSDLRSYLANQETALMDILVEELHEHLYLKSPYCQERWQTLAKHQGAGSSSSGSTSSNTASGGAPGVSVLGATMGVTASASDTPANFVPFFALLDSMDVEQAVQEDPARNPEGDTFYYITLVVESLNKLGRLEAAVDQLKNRLPVELFSVVHETVNEIDQKHPSSLRGGSGSGPGSYLARGGGGGGSGGGANGDASNASGSGGAGAGAGAGGSSSSSAAAFGAAAAASAGLHIYGSRETQMRADVIYDLLWTLYGKFEAIAEGHRIFHEYIKALIRREGAGNNSALLGSFKELWNLYQNEIRSLLHNYVTTDADLYRSGGHGGGDRSSLLLNGGGLGRNGSLGASSSRENIFKFNEADAKSLEMATEYEALDGIIRAAVPGLTSNNGAGGAGGSGGGGGAAGSGGNAGANRGGRKGGDKKGGRKSYGAAGSLDPMAQAGGAGGGGGDFHKSLVEPSVFNMSLLLPPTLVFLQRLRGIVPPGSDLAASTLTSFLDNFLVNVFQPQLDETLGKLSDAVFGEADAFQIDPQWSQVARRPVFKGTTAFFSVVTAFCRMLGTIPHDQALSALIITQMMRYYDRCFSWYKALVTKTQVDNSGANDASASASSPTGSDADTQRLRVSAVLALEGGDVANTVRALWAVDEELADAADAGASSTATNSAVDDQVVLMHKKTALLQREVEQLLARYSGKSQRLGMSDVISDRDAITSLCLLYTSMKWLAIKIGGLRHIARPDGDSAGPGRAANSSGANTLGTSGSGSGALSKPDKRRWTLLNTESGKALADAGPVYLPMTQESVQSFDSIVSSYEELASTSLLTLHLEVRCRIAYALGVALSPEATAPYLLDQDVNEPDPQILSLNGELIAYDETVVRCLVRDREVDFVRQGLGRLVNAYLVGNAKMVTPMNSRGCGRMQLNILVLQQNLKNIEDGVDLARAANYYALFDKGPDAIVAKAKECKERQKSEAASADTSADGEAANSNDTFTYDELKELIELYYSEQLANPERGIENAARRQMGEKLMELGEHLWQM